MLKLNLGCGFDYREGFINIDGRGDLPRVDKVIDLSKSSLLDFFCEGTVDFILANDFLEHHFHWEAIRLMSDFYAALKPAGIIEMRLPDFEKIVNSWKISLEQKITLLFGGQDIPQGDDDPSSRERYPGFFCHKYAYTRKTMQRELSAIGFIGVETETVGTNFLVKARKP